MCVLHFAAHGIMSDAKPAGRLVERGSHALLDAFVVHYEELTNYLLRHIAFRQSDQSAARDVLHDVCVELIERPPVAIHTPLAFLYRMASRRAVDHYRHESLRSAPLPEQTSLSAEVDWVDPYRIVSGRLQIGALVDAIAQLPPRCRDVFVMYKIHCWSHADIARHLGISVKMVEKHLSAGMQRCRMALIHWVDDVDA